MDLSNPTAQQMVGSIIRSLLTAAGAGTAMSPDQMTAGAGALAVLIGVAWGVASIRYQAEEQHGAVVRAVSRVAADPMAAHEVICASRAGQL